jgi:hypothetical protein
MSESGPTLRRELLILGGALALCPLVAIVEPGNPAGAVARAQRILAVEGALGLDVEAVVHGWLASRPLVRAVADLLYLALHVSALVGVFAWSAARAPARYLQLRRLFVTSHVITVSMYLRWPTAPPRLIDVDSRAPADASGLLHHLQYEYAAVPSGHVVFAAVVAVGLRSAPSLAWRTAGAVYPWFVTALIVATGHHLLLDAVIGVAVVALAHVALRLAASVCATIVRTDRSSNSSSRPSTSSLDTTDRISPECADPLLERASS